MFDLYWPLYDYFMRVFGLFRHELVIEKLHLQPNDKILDVAGGTGFIASKLKQISNDITVLDISSKMLSKAHKRGLNTVKGSAMNIPFAPNVFDIVICIDGLHHIKRHEKAINEFTRVLKSGGRIFIFDFHQKTFFGKLFKMFELAFIDSSKFITPENLEKLMTKHGFTGKTEIYSGYEYYYIGTKQSNGVGPSL